MTESAANYHSINPFDYQVGGQHYKEYGEYQPWLVLRRWLSDEAMIGFLRGNAMKYLARFGGKQGETRRQDVAKAIHYLRYLEGILLTIEQKAEGALPAQEIALYRAHSGAPGAKCRVQYRREYDSFIRLMVGGGGFWVPNERLSPYEASYEVSKND